MKLKSHFAFRAFSICLLLSTFFFVPMKGNSQTPENTYALIGSDNSAKTDVSAYLVYDSDQERYTLIGVNPSRKKLRIFFYAGGTRYVYRASTATFSKPFDLKGADDGVYTFGLQDGKVLLKTNVQIKTTMMTKREAIIASML